jgi:protein transport protein HofC
MKKLKPAEIILILQGLHTLLSAGLELVPSLELQAKERIQFAREFTQINQYLREGQSFTQAFSQFFIIPYQVLNTLRLGENSGDLAQACALCVKNLQDQLAWKRMAWSLSFYPLILLITSLGLFGVMMIFVLPEFASLYQTLNLPLPQSTAWILGSSEWAPDVLKRSILILLIVSLIVSLAWRHPEGRSQIENILIHLPLIRGLIISHQAYHLSAQLGLLLEAGASLSNSLEFIRSSTRSPSFSRYLSQVQQGIRQGFGLRQSFCQGSHQDPRLGTLLAHAQQTGHLDKVFQHLAAAHRETLVHWQDRAKHMIQPVITLILGGFLGIWILLLYYPMLQLGTNLG